MYERGETGRDDRSQSAKAGASCALADLSAPQQSSISPELEHLDRRLTQCRELLDSFVRAQEPFERKRRLAGEAYDDVRRDWLRQHLGVRNTVGHLIERSEALKVRTLRDIQSNLGLYTVVAVNLLGKDGRLLGSGAVVPEYAPTRKYSFQYIDASSRVAQQTLRGDDLRKRFRNSAFERSEPAAVLQKLARGVYAAIEERSASSSSVEHKSLAGGGKQKRNFKSQSRRKGLPPGKTRRNELPESYFRLLSGSEKSRAAEIHRTHEQTAREIYELGNAALEPNVPEQDRVLRERIKDLRTVHEKSRDDVHALGQEIQKVGDFLERAERYRGAVHELACLTGEVRPTGSRITSPLAGDLIYTLILPGAKSEVIFRKEEESYSYVASSRRKDNFELRRASFTPHYEEIAETLGALDAGQCCTRYGVILSGELQRQAQIFFENVEEQTEIFPAANGQGYRLSGTTRSLEDLEPKEIERHEGLNYLRSLPYDERLPGLVFPGRTTYTAFRFGDVIIAESAEVDQATYVLAADAFEDLRKLTRQQIIDGEVEGLITRIFHPGSDQDSWRNWKREVRRHIPQEIRRKMKAVSG